MQRDDKRGVQREGGDEGVFLFACGAVSEVDFTNYRFSSLSCSLIVSGTLILCTRRTTDSDQCRRTARAHTHLHLRARAGCNSVTVSDVAVKELEVS